MFRPAPGLLALLFALAASLATAAQSLDNLSGGWRLDRPASTFGPGDPGSERLDFVISPAEVTVIKAALSQYVPESVWKLALDGSPPPPPRIGSATQVDDTLVITHARRTETVIHVYRVVGEILRVERTVRWADGRGDFTHTMVYRRIG